MTERLCVAVAYSAGRDSTALLHATVRAAIGTGVQVVALHVHHGLSRQADAWVTHARATCSRWADLGWPVHLKVHRTSTRPVAGESIEAWARGVRYAALSEMARNAGASLVLLAQHRRDQAETFVLQALRGAGVAGLAAMPACAGRDGLTWYRPWLDRSRASIEQYVVAHGLSYVDDDSNTDLRFARNRLRLEVWPALAQAFPQAEVSLASTCEWAQQAAECLREVAESDLAVVAEGASLRLAKWSQLSFARGANALRSWLHLQGGRAPPATLVRRLHRELNQPAPNARWLWDEAMLRCHRGRLIFVPAAVSPASDQPARETALSVRRAGGHRLVGWQGILRFARVKEGGVPLAWLAHLELRVRQGGEQFQAGIGRPSRALKKQYQAMGVPVWKREGPLVYSGGQLVYVPGLGIDARVIGLPGQPQMMLIWESFNAVQHNTGDCDAAPAR